MGRVRIPPLRDDVLQRHPNFVNRDWGVSDKKHVYLCRSLAKQLKARPEVWGIGLWPDERIETAAKRLAELFYIHYAMPNNRFIPDDPFHLIGGYDDDLGPSEVIQAIEEEFLCEFPNDALKNEPDMTFQRFVEVILNCQGNCPQKRRAEPTASEQRLYIGVIIAVLAFVGWLIWKAIWFVIGLFK